MASDYLTPVEIASILKISKAKVLRLIANEEFPYTRYHRRIIVRLEYLNKYIHAVLTATQYPHSEVMASAHKEFSL